MPTPAANATVPRRVLRGLVVREDRAGAVVAPLAHYPIKSHEDAGTECDCQPRARGSVMQVGPPSPLRGISAPEYLRTSTRPRPTHLAPGYRWSRIRAEQRAPAPRGNLAIEGVRVDGT